jgi:hypothetical protein
MVGKLIELCGDSDLLLEFGVTHAIESEAQI